MIKSELIEQVSKECDISKAQAQRVVDSVLDTIADTLKNGGEVSLLGFGTFSVVQRAARTARNLVTNEPMEIPSVKVPKFRPGKNLKDAVK